MAYDPDVVEWISLSLFCVLGLLTWFSVVTFAMGFQWKLWWEDPRIRKPSIIFHPVFYGGLLFVVSLLSGIAAWLNWREGHRSLQSSQLSEQPPSDSEFFWANFLFVVYWLIGILSGPCFFTLGMQYQTFYITCIFTIVMCALSIGLVTVSFFIWSITGVLFIITSIFWFYSILISVMCCRSYDYRYCIEPVQNIFNMINIENNNNNANYIRKSAPVPNMYQNRSQPVFQGPQGYWQHPLAPFQKFN